jgi:hypothetical protein
VSASHFPKEYLAELDRRVDIVSLIGEYVPLKRAGRLWEGRCPFHSEKTGSFMVYPGRDGHYHCFGCGAHGGAITFLMQIHNLEFREAVLELAARVGMEPPAGMDVAGFKAKGKARPLAMTAKRTSDEEAKASAARRSRFVGDLVRDIWRRCRRAELGPVEAYLRRRAIDIDAMDGVPASLRYHTDLEIERNGPRYRAMVAGVQRGGKIVGLHRTYLKPDGATDPHKAIAKKMLGDCWGGAVRLAPADGTGRLATSEGIETGLTFQGWKRLAGDRLPVWAALSMGNIAGAGDARMQRRAPAHSWKRLTDPKTGADRGPMKLPTEYPDMDRPGLILPAWCKELIILADGDSDPEITGALMNRAARRFQAGGVTVRIAWPPAGLDWNDVALRAMAPAGTRLAS